MEITELINAIYCMPFRPKSQGHRITLRSISCCGGHKGAPAPCTHEPPQKNSEFCSCLNLSVSVLPYNKMWKILFWSPFRFEFWFLLLLTHIILFDSRCLKIADFKAQFSVSYFSNSYCHCDQKIFSSLSCIICKSYLLFCLLAVCNLSKKSLAEIWWQSLIIIVMWIWCEM